MGGRRSDASSPPPVRCIACYSGFSRRRKAASVPPSSSAWSGTPRDVVGDGEFESHELWSARSETSSRAPFREVRRGGWVARALSRMLAPPRVAITAAVLGASGPLAATCHASSLIKRRLTGRGASVRFTLASADRVLTDMGSPQGLAPAGAPLLGGEASSVPAWVHATPFDEGRGGGEESGSGSGVAEEWELWSQAEQAARRGEQAAAELDLRGAWKSFAEASALASAAGAGETGDREEAKWYFRAAACKNACDYAYAIHDAITERHLREVFTPTRGEDTPGFAAQLARGAFNAARELVLAAPVLGDGGGSGGGGGGGGEGGINGTSSSTTPAAVQDSRKRAALACSILALCAARLVVFAEGGGEKLRMAGLMKQMCEEAVRLDPECESAWYMLGRWHNDVAGIPRVLRAVARMVYGVSLKASLREGLAHCERAVGLQPKVYSHYELARGLLELGEAERALAHLKRAASMDFDCINGYLYQRAAADGLRLAAQAAAGEEGAFNLGRPQYTQREGGAEEPAPA